MVSTEIDHQFLEYDAWMTGTDHEVMGCLRLADGQFYDLLHHTAGNGGLEHGVHVGLAVNECLIEIDGLWC